MEYAKNKYVVYTAIFDDYDALAEPPSHYENVDLVCFTNNNKLTSSTWNIELISTEGDPRAMNRRLKFFPHLYLSQYEYAIYIDGNIELTADPTPLFDKYKHRCVVAAPKHPERSCVYKEAEHCIKGNKGNEQSLLQQISTYKSEGYPGNNGLYEMNVIFRAVRDEKVIELMQQWWKEYAKGSGRDQVSFPYVAWKNDANVLEFEESPRRKNKYFKPGMHSSEKKLPPLKRLVLFVRLNKHKSHFFFLLCRFIESLRKK